MLTETGSFDTLASDVVMSTGSSSAGAKIALQDFIASKITTNF